MKLLDVITAAGGRTSGGDPYQWDCFGENAQYLEFRDTDGRGCSHCIFDTKDYTVYQIHADVPGTDQAFQWTNPQYVVAYIEESKDMGVDPDTAWDEVKYTIVNDETTMLQYVKDIGECDYTNLPESEPKVGPDGKVSVPLTLTDEETLRLMTLAHEANMTLNQFVEKILWEQIRRHQEETNTFDMPGTMGSAKLVFTEENEMTERYMVKLDVRFELDVEADSANKALEKARHFQETMNHEWGKGENVIWHDKYIVKEAVERTLEY